MKIIQDIEHLEGVKVIVRVDYNVPIRNGFVVDDFRIRSSLETIDFLLSRGAKVILIAHLESADGTNPTLEPASITLNNLGVKTRFIPNLKNAYSIIENELGNGECILLENLRFFEGEKKNDEKFAKELASLADIYVNDAFSVSHRKHASVVGLPKLLPSYAGIQLNREVANLSRAFSPTHPFLFIIGGAKFDTKLPLIERFSKLADSIFMGGALANDILKARGVSVGKSKVSENNTHEIAKIASDNKIVVPIDVIVTDHKEKDVNAISAEDAIYDAGRDTISFLAEQIKKSNFVLWNGPLGTYEDGYQGATLELAKIIAERGAKDKSFISIVGGGDTTASISNLNIEDKFTFISTGGGAMLDFLAQGTLPGIEALKM